jgi:tetratricopeptide (TPR) repeat protein
MAQAEFALGVASGYKAVYEARWGGPFATIKQGIRAKGHFQRALEQDSTLCDGYLGLGTYLYWKSAKTDWINWLPLVPDVRDRGLLLLERAVQCGIFARETARAALASALFNERRYSEAIAHADTLASLFPNGKGPLWLKGKAYFGRDEWDEALPVFDTLEARIRQAGPGNFFNLIECAYYRTLCHTGAGRYRKALSECEKALAYPGNEETRKRRDGKLRELRRIRHRLVRMLSL